MQKKQNEEKIQKEEYQRQQNVLKKDFENQIKMKEVATKYDKLFERNFEKQLLVSSS